MNTRTSEVRLILTDLLQTALKSGITPDFLELVESEEFHNLGDVKNGLMLSSNVADSTQINSNIDSIELNTKILDECASLQAESTLNHRNTFASRINRLERWYRNLAYRVQSLVLLTRTGTRSLHVISDTFSSLDNIDLNNTTAYIDTVLGQAEIPSTPIENSFETESGRANVAISSAIIKDGDKEVDVTSQPNSLYYIYNSSNTKDVELHLTLSINKNNDIFNGSYIIFKLLNDNTTDVINITSSSDFINYEETPFLKFSSYIKIGISKLYKNRTIKITLKKNWHDAEKILDNGNVRHSFVFGISGLLLPNKKYLDSAVVQTVAFELPEYMGPRGISQARLVFDSQCLGDTRVTPSIKYGSGDFFNIQPGEAFPIGNTAYKQTSHPSGQVTREVPTPIFRLEGQTETPVMETAVLIEGFQQAEVETKTYTADAAILSNWVTTPGTCAYQNLKSTGIWLGGERSHKIYLCIRSKKAQDLILSNIGVRHNAAPDVDVSNYIYFNFNGQPLNGKQLSNGSLEYRLPIVAGINKLNILVGIDGVTGGYLNLGELITPDTEIFVKERQCTSLAAIMSLDDTNKAFAVNENKIYLNYIPPINASFVHRFNTPTTNLPTSMTLKFDLIGANGLSPLLGPYRLEFTPTGVA